MQITLKGKNYAVTDAIREYVETRVGKATRHFDGVISSDVTLSTERNWHIVEVTLYASGFVLRGEERTNDMYASVDLVIDKLSKQLRKQKGKWDKRLKTQKHKDSDFFQVELPRGEEAYEEEEELVLADPRVVRIPIISQKPMTVEEAIKEMEALDFSFFMFVNARTELLNVLYRRKEGFGLVDPSMERKQ